MFPRFTCFLQFAHDTFGTSTCLTTKMHTNNNCVDPFGSLSKMQFYCPTGAQASNGCLRIVALPGRKKGQTICHLLSRWEMCRWRCGLCCLCVLPCLHNVYLCEDKTFNISILVWCDRTNPSKPPWKRRHQQVHILHCEDILKFHFPTNSSQVSLYCGAWTADFHGFSFPSRSPSVWKVPDQAVGRNYQTR